MIDRARKLMAVVAALAVLVVSHCSKPAAEVCLERSLQDLAAWRWVEPRLSAGLAWQPCTELPAAGRVLAEVRCPAGHSGLKKVSFVSEACDAAGRQHSSALRALVLRADKTDEAVKTLENLAPTAPSDARLLNDLAAAYLVRARRTGQPIDLLRSFDAALQAVKADGSLPEARFNLALAQEEFGLPAEWSAYLSRDPSSSWAGEARKRAARQARRTAAISWILNRARLSQAVRAGDHQALSELIKPFPAATQRYLEEEVLPGWARERSQGRPKEAEGFLSLARAIAAELAGRTGDRYMAETVATITGASGSPAGAANLQALIEGHLALREARLAQQVNEFKVAEDEYRQAGAFLGRAGSPLREGADLGLAIVRFQSREASLDEVLARVGVLERESRLHGHRYLLGRVLGVRALCLALQGRSLKSLSSYDEAIGELRRIGDREDVANVRARKAGVFRMLGEGALAWEEVFQALPDLPWIADLPSRHYLLGEAAAVARSQRLFPSALWLQTRAVEMVRDALKQPGLAGTAAGKGLRFNLVVSIRGRAEIEVEAGMHEAANRDLAQARQLLEPEMLEVLGKEQLASDPRKALESWTEALRLSPRGENRSLVASLHFQIALAHLDLGQRGEAEEHLQTGLAELKKEEETLLAGRLPGEGEKLWTAYFSRFQEAYRSLIILLLEDHREPDAFAYAEKARAFEPLDLVLRQPFAPPELLRMTGSREPLRLSQVQQHLPADTFLIEYCVFEDRLVLWVVSRTDCKVLTHKVRREVLTRWTRTLQASTKTKEVEAFEAQLTAPFPDIVGEPLQIIRKALGRHPERGSIVFIPDGPLHGLPLPALRDQRTGRRVIEDFPVAIAPSATLYVYSRLRDADISRHAGAPTVLLIGDPASRWPLAGAADEVRRIGALYQGAKILTKVLTGEQATVDRFLALAQGSSIIHFAGHAVTDPGNLSRSFLLFAPTPEHPGGELRAEEILRRLRLAKTRLVILSSCGSAGDGAVGPEGLAPLVRPLIAAGSPAVVASLWKVQDQATAELLVRFHQYYFQGEDAARALRHAQLDLKDRPVLFWAPFQVIGHAGSPFPRNHERRDTP